MRSLMAFFALLSTAFLMGQVSSAHPANYPDHTGEWILDKNSSDGLIGVAKDIATIYLTIIQDGTDLLVKTRGMDRKGKLKFTHESTYKIDGATNEIVIDMPDLPKDLPLPIMDLPKITMLLKASWLERAGMLNLVSVCEFETNKNAVNLFPSRTVVQDFLYLSPDNRLLTVYRNVEVDRKVEQAKLLFRKRDNVRSDSIQSRY